MRGRSLLSFITFVLFPARCADSPVCDRWSLPQPPIFGQAVALIVNSLLRRLHVNFPNTSDIPRFRNGHAALRHLFQCVYHLKELDEPLLGTLGSILANALESSIGVLFCWRSEFNAVCHTGPSSLPRL